MREEKVFFPSNGIQLEGLLSIQEALPLKGGVVFCHPHPQYGGDMHSHVITTTVETAFQEGFSTLRFNFRGVGESEGSYGEGIEEKEDALAAIEYLSLKLKEFNPSFILVGYSFGAWVGLPVAIQDRRIEGIAAIAPPLGMYDFSFMKGCKKRKLILSGDRDFFCPTFLLEKWYQSLDDPKSLVLLPGADHFFSFHTHLLKEPFREFLRMKNAPF